MGGYISCNFCDNNIAIVLRLIPLFVILFQRAPSRLALLYLSIFNKGAVRDLMGVLDD